MNDGLNDWRARLSQLATEIPHRLERLGSQRIVLAESCTAGMIAATLGSVPGISGFLCGSMVTYRAATKSAWLGLAAEWIQVHTAESAPVTREMAKSVLQCTPEATLSLAITGHLGPGIDSSRDGLIFVCIGRRHGDQTEILANGEFRLFATGRTERQMNAAFLALEFLAATLDGLSAPKASAF